MNAVRPTRVLAAIFVLALATSAQAYTFQKVLELNTSGLEALGLPHLNDAGQVAFHGTSDGVNGIYVAEIGTAPQLVVDATHPQFDSFDPFTFINNSGTVVGWAQNTTTDEQYIYTAAPGQGADIIAQTNTTYDNFTSAPTINDDGLVAFASNTRTRIHTRQYPDPPTTLLDTTGDFNTFWLPQINNDGAISFFGIDDDKGAVYRRDDDGSLTTILDNQGEFTGLLPYSTPNSAGEVAIHARRPGDPPSKWAIVRGDGGPVETLAEAADHGFADSAFDLEINDNGFVAFGPRMAADSSLALYAHDGDDLHKVLQRGDALFGDTLRDVFFVRGLNQNNQVAFLYLLDNDEVGIGLTNLSLPQLLPGDMNLDAAVNTADVAPFVLALTNPRAYMSQYGVDHATMAELGDINGDGAFNTADVAPFVEMLVSGDATVPEPGSLALLGAAGLMLLGRGPRWQRGGRG